MSEIKTVEHNGSNSLKAQVFNLGKVHVKIVFNN